MALPVDLQRLQLLTGSLTWTCPFPPQPGQSEFGVGVPAQNPQVLSEYADMLILQQNSAGLNRKAYDRHSILRNDTEWTCRLLHKAESKWLRTTYSPSYSGW